MAKGVSNRVPLSVHRYGQGSPTRKAVYRVFERHQEIMERRQRGEEHAIRVHPDRTAHRHRRSRHPRRDRGVLPHGGHRSEQGGSVHLGREDGRDRRARRTQARGQRLTARTSDRCVLDTTLPPLVAPVLATATPSRWTPRRHGHRRRPAATSTTSVRTPTTAGCQSLGSVVDRIHTVNRSARPTGPGASAFTRNATKGVAL